MPPKSIQPADGYYTSKWGRILIFNGDNYATFAQTCTLALLSARAWPIVTRGEAQPVANNALNDWLRRRAIAIQIISSSVGPLHINSIMDLARNEDPASMWDELAKADRSDDKVYVAQVKDDFQSERFDPTQHTLQDFVARLNSHRTLVANTQLPLEDSDVLNKLMQSLPKGDPVWQAERHYCLRNDLDLQSTILQLKRLERPIPQTTEPTEGIAAKATHRRRDQRSKGKEKEMESRPKRQRSPSTSSSRSRSTSPSSYKCYFCGKKGHVQRNCKAYKKARNRVYEKGKDKSEDDKSDEKGKGKSKESIHFARLAKAYGLEEGSLS
jgi:hypothetical protein